MERFIYANAFGLIAVFAEHVAILRAEPTFMNGAMIVAILVFVLNILGLIDERIEQAKPVNRFIDFPPAPVDNKGYHYGL